MHTASANHAVAGSANAALARPHLSLMDRSWRGGLGALEASAPKIGAERSL
jgi:hypothetical protein